MNDFLLIFMGIFILLLIFLIFILLAYVYHTYTTYTVDINKNLETSETNINNTAKAFNKLQDNIINELAKVNKNQETIIKTVPDNLVSLNSNILDIFNLKDDKDVNIEDITKNKISVGSINVVKPFTSYKNLTAISDANNYFTICNSKSGPNRACVRMNIDDSDMFNIYTSNLINNNSNIKGINIYDSNNNVLASFDQFNKKILLGSGLDSTAAIKIIDNVYTPDVIVCKYMIADVDTTAGAAIDAANSKKVLANSKELELSTYITTTANSKKAIAVEKYNDATIVTSENAVSLTEALITAATEANNTVDTLIEKIGPVLIAANNAGNASTYAITSAASSTKFNETKEAALNAANAGLTAAKFVQDNLNLINLIATAAKDAAQKALSNAESISTTATKNTKISNANIQLAKSNQFLSAENSLINQININVLYSISITSGAKSAAISATAPQASTVTAIMTLQIISNIEIKSDKVINLPIINDFEINGSSELSYSYNRQILKIKSTSPTPPASPTVVIPKNTITTKIVNITKNSNTILGGSTTNGYITLS